MISVAVARHCHYYCIALIVDSDKYYCSVLAHHIEQQFRIFIFRWRAAAGGPTIELIANICTHHYITSLSNNHQCSQLAGSSSTAPQLLLVHSKAGRAGRTIELCYKITKCYCSSQ